MKSSQIRRKLIEKIIISLFIVSTLMSLFFINLNYIHLKEDLIKHNEDTIKHLKTMIDSQLRSYKDMLIQINSRTMIRNKLEDYLEKKISINELRIYSQPKLNDAVKKIEDIIYFIRMTRDGDLVSEIGDKVEFNLDFFPEKDFFISDIIDYNGENYIYLYSKIYNSKKEYLAYDLMVLNIKKLKKMLGENKEKILIYDKNKIILSNYIETYIDRKHNMVFNNKLNMINWEINLIQNKKEFYKPLKNNLIYLILIAFLILIIGLVVAMLITKSLVGKIILNETELKKEVEEKTERIQNEIKLKERIYSVLAHDLRSPISSTLSLLEYLSIEWKQLDDNEKISYFEESRASLFNQLDLMDNLLQWVKYSEKNSELKKSDLSIAKEIEDVINLYSDLVRFKNINLNIEVEDDYTIYVNENMFQSILRNMLSNAIKYTEEEGKIEIRAKKEKGSVFIEIEDNGIGMTEEELSIIMKNEFNNSKKGTKDELGTGFGIGLIKSFVEKNNGELEIFSEKDKGTKVKIGFRI